MALPVVISRNQVQKTNKRTIKWTNDVIQPTIWYTCPTGKIAIVKGSVTCQDTGAGANADINFAGVRYARWLATGGDTDVVILDSLAEGAIIHFENDLEAGDTIETVQDSGTNAQFKFQAVIEEFNI